MPRPQVVLDHVVELLPQRMHLRLLRRLGEVERVDLLVAEFVGDVGQEALPRGVAAAGRGRPFGRPPTEPEPAHTLSRVGRLLPPGRNAGRVHERPSYPQSPPPNPPPPPP